MQNKDIDTKYYTLEKKEKTKKQQKAFLCT